MAVLRLMNSVCGKTGLQMMDMLGRVEEGDDVCNGYTLEVMLEKLRGTRNINDKRKLFYMGRLPRSLLFNNLIMHMEFLGDKDASRKEMPESSVSVARPGASPT